MTTGADENSRRLLVISSGSWGESIQERNASGRLQASRAVGVFPFTDYVFFRTPESSVRRLEDGLTVHEVGGYELGGPWSSIGWLRRIVLLWSGLREIDAIARADPPSLVTCVDPFLIGFLAVRLARKHRVPVALSLVSHCGASYRAGGVKPIPFLPAWLAFRLEAWVIRNADMVLVDREFYGQYAMDRGARPESVHHFPCYVETEFYSGTPDPDVWSRLGVDDVAPLVYVGRLSPEKYSIDLIRYFARVREDFPNKELVVVGGEGPLRGEVVREAERLGVADGLKVVGPLHGEALLGAMAGASVVRAPHAGYSLLECALASAPIIAYDFEWHPEIVIHGETGLLVPYRDWEAMARETVGLLGDPERASELGRAARDRGPRLHRPEHTIAALADSYLQVLGGA